jgi:MFS family permease
MFTTIKGTPMKLDWRKTFLIGLGFFGISLIWQVYNLFMPLFLQAGNPAFDTGGHTNLLGFGLDASVAGFIMTLDNIAALFILPLIGIWSDRTRTRFGRRYPYILIGAPLAALAFVLIPVAAGAINPEANGSVASNPGAFAFLMVVAGAMLLAMAFFRTPVIALMPDLTPSEQRSKANGVINFMGGLGGVLAALGLARLFDSSHILPFLLSSVVLIISVILLFIFVREPKLPAPAETEPREPQESRSILKAARGLAPEQRRNLLLLMAAIFAWFVGYSAIETFFSSYAVTTLKLQAGEAGMRLSVSIIAFIVFAIPAGYIGARFGRKRTISFGLFVFAILLILAFLMPNLTFVTIALGAGGFAWALVNINSLPMVVDLTDDPRQLGTYTGFYYLASQLAAIAGPVVNGIIIDLTGKNYNSIFLVAPVFFVMALTAMLFVTRGEARQAATGAVLSSAQGTDV